MQLCQAMMGRPRRGGGAARVGLVALSCAAGLAAGSSRLRVVNGCASEPLWIAHQGVGGAGPDPQNVRIDPWGSYDFTTLGDLRSTRYWAKMGCDPDGNDCSLGGSGGVGQDCVGPDDDYTRCAPPIDTKFEATFGADGAPCDPQANAMAGCDYVDISLVDGFTLPFKLELQGNCNKGGSVIDCSGLSLAHCPVGEHLYSANMVANLQAVNPHTEQVVGCYSPCARIIDDKWGNVGRDPSTPQAAPYCCPTPPESPQQCRTGPVKDTMFVQTVHRLCPGVYGYAYDDGMGLIRCDATTQYVLTFFCPPEPVRRGGGAPLPQAVAVAAWPSLREAIRRVLTLGGLIQRYQVPHQRDFLGAARSEKAVLPPRPEGAAPRALLGGGAALAVTLAGTVAFAAAAARAARSRLRGSPWHDARPLSPPASAAFSAASARGEGAE